MRRPAAIVLVVLALLAGGAATNDPLVDQQYHLETVEAFDAWRAGRGEGVVVAVIDTGVDLSHPDLQGRLVGGIDFIEPGTLPDDENGHGTLVAGIVAANVGNGIGVAGAAPGALIMPVRVLDAAGGGVSDDVAEGIRWAADNGADVINLSLAEAPGQARAIDELITSDVEAAIRDASLQGALVVAASGNEGRYGSPYGSTVPVLVVGATDRDDVVWPHSNRDEGTLFAPGVGIVSTYTQDSGYAKADGTSFATAIVSAGAAMLRGLGLDAYSARDRLVQTAVPVGLGLGRVQLAAAAGAAEAAAPPSAAPAEPTESPSQRDAAGASPPATVVPPQAVTPALPAPPAASEPAPALTVPDPGPTAAPDQPPELALSAPAAARPDADASPRWPLPVATALLIANLAALQAYAAARRRGGQDAG